ncbi:restriction endonuclease subunit S [Tatumella terrea]|uniref:Restriction endonuclease subunit S n=1 Tax=Tatumella terrea TaxID=419007 RepID=A0ABW1VWK7_9GAMM
MSELSYLEKLLGGAEVEWVPLGNICEFKNGFAFKSSLFKNSGLPIVRITNIDGLNVNLDDVKYFSQSDYKDNLSSFKVSFGDILIAMSGATTGKVGFYCENVDSYLNQRVGKFIPKVDILTNKYLYHFLLLSTESIYILAGGGAQPNLSSNALMAKLLIPIPCPNNPEKSLAIQSEIVRILDKFTSLTAELTAELTARKKQYNYYRDQLLSFEEGVVPHVPMGQEGVGEFIRGGSLQKKDFTEIGVGCIHYGQIYTYYGTYTNQTKVFVSEELASKCRKAQQGNLVIATTSENDEDVCKAVAWLGKEDIAVSSDACIYKHRMNPKYVSYFFQTEQFQQQKKKYITGAKVRRVNADSLAKILIPNPSLAEQSRIVAILDKFDTLTDSISEGLPREIELRQKQYEYYRDLLFSFPKPETVHNTH